MRYPPVGGWKRASAQRGCGGKVNQLQGSGFVKQAGIHDYEVNGRVGGEKIASDVLMDKFLLLIAKVRPSLSVLIINS